MGEARQLSGSLKSPSTHTISNDGPNPSANTLRHKRQVRRAKTRQATYRPRQFVVVGHFGHGNGVVVQQLQQFASIVQTASVVANHVANRRKRFAQTVFVAGGKGKKKMKKLKKMKQKKTAMVARKKRNVEPSNNNVIFGCHRRATRKRVTNCLFWVEKAVERNSNAKHMYRYFPTSKVDGSRSSIVKLKKENRKKNRGKKKKRPKTGHKKTMRSETNCFSLFSWVTLFFLKKKSNQSKANSNETNKT